MNKDQIMRAVENASPEQVKALAWLLGIDNEQPIKVHGLTAEQLSVLKFFFVPEQQQVPVTQRHVGCVVHLNHASHESIISTEMLTKATDKFGYEGFRADYWFGHAFFPNPYRVPITHRWSGGQQPVADGVLVLVQFHDRKLGLHEAGKWFWGHTTAANDNIIGYTVLDVIGVEDE